MMTRYIRIAIFILFCSSVLSARGSDRLSVYNYLQIRGGMPHFYKCVHTNHKATVAFVGGSITFNPGWRDKLCSWLKERYPEVQFNFVTAAIPSLGCVAHVFRLQHDLLETTDPDLVLYESAVNDRGNGTDSLTQIRSLEGIIRQIKTADVHTDIVMISLADPDKTRDYDHGKIPVEIACHEAIAAHYHLPSVNLGKEVREMIQHGELDWDRDFKDIHPAEPGQDLYFHTISAMIDTCLKKPDLSSSHRELPSLPLPRMLNRDNFEWGHYDDLRHALPDTGWTLDPDWAPSDGLSTRDGFVHVPMLIAVNPDAVLRFSFTGTSVGIAVVAGADAGIISYSIDSAPFKEADLYTIYSSMLYLPSYLLLGSNLNNGTHQLTIRTTNRNNEHSKGHACRIVHFLVNGPSRNNGLLLHSAANSLRLFYDKPAEQWEETLPLGNGRLGMTPDGGILQERIVLNDITLWSGSVQDANNYDAYKKLPVIRQLIIDGKNDEAQSIVDKDFVCTGPGSGDPRWGCFQILGNLDLRFAYGGVPDSLVKAVNYKRSLSLQDAIARCSYQVGEVTYTRECFTSFGDDIAIIRLSANKPGQINCSLSVNRPEKAHSHIAGDVLQLYGQLENGIDGKGMQFIASVKARLQGGRLTSAGDKLQISQADTVLIYVSMKTDYKDSAYKEHSAQLLSAALNKPYTQEIREHLTHYRRMFDRVSLNLGSSDAAGLPTDQRLIRFGTDPGGDPSLPVLFFQYGRYLSISSTRVGLLPPNLQGLWANQVQTPWNGDYHLDINVQMNHWALESVNLSELNLPLADLVAAMVPHGEKTAKAYYNARGWVAHVITNIWQFTEPGESASWGISKAGSGWLCNNLWQHYSYTNDLAYLRKIYPVLKGSAQFYSSMLIKDPVSGWLVTSPASSPENWFYLPDGSGKTASVCMGPTIDNQIIRELFTNVITASQQLGLDADLRQDLERTLQYIPPAGQIAKDGRLMEWLQDYKETEVHHRHIAHLYGLYPAALITPEKTPDLAEASRKTLEARGDDGPSWSIAYKLLFWARLYDGNRAYKLFRTIMRPTLRTDINYGSGGGVYPNLLSAGPPFQIDGNFGACAGIAEMLLQSHAGFISLLPAIPDGWRAGGEVRGLRAEGNYTVDFGWKNGRVTWYRIRTGGKYPGTKNVKIKVNGQFKIVKAAAA